MCNVSTGLTPVREIHTPVSHVSEDTVHKNGAAVLNVAVCVFACVMIKLVGLLYSNVAPGGRIGPKTCCWLHSVLTRLSSNGC